MDALDASTPDRRRMSFLRWLADPLILPRPGENPLADFTLGHSPKSRRRARRALAEATFHLPLYGCITLGASFVAAKAGMETLDDWMMLIAFCQIASTILALFCLPFRKLGLRNLRANWDDYRMAGLPPRQIIVGLAAGGVRSARAAFSFFMVVALLQYGLWLWTYLVPNKYIHSSDFFLVATLAAVAALDLALWIPLGQSISMARYRLHSAALLALLMLIPLTSTISLFLLLNGVMNFLFRLWRGRSLYELVGYGGIGLIFLLTLLRPVIVAALWHRTKNRLDSDGP